MIDYLFIWLQNPSKIVDPEKGLEIVTRLTELGYAGIAVSLLVLIGLGIKTYGDVQRKKLDNLRVQNSTNNDLKDFLIDLKPDIKDIKESLNMTAGLMQNFVINVQKSIERIEDKQNDIAGEVKVLADRDRTINGIVDSLVKELGRDGNN